MRVRPEIAPLNLIQVMLAEGSAGDSSDSLARVGGESLWIHDPYPSHFFILKIFEPSFLDQRETFIGRSIEGEEIDDSAEQ